MEESSKQNAQHVQRLCGGKVYGVIKKLKESVVGAQRGKKKSEEEAADKKQILYSVVSCKSGKKALILSLRKFGGNWIF